MLSSTTTTTLLLYHICPQVSYTTTTTTIFPHMDILRRLNRFAGFLVFLVLDIVDFSLCFTYKALDFFFESEWKPCYCSPPAKPPATGASKILVSEQGEYSKIVSLTRTKIQLDEISDTLYSRPSLLIRFSKLVSFVNFDALSRFSRIDGFGHNVAKSRDKKSKKRLLRVSSTVVEKLQRVPRWSDCHCKFCTSWVSCPKDSLFVRVQQPKDNKAQENVLFIHGFLSSSAFWTQTLFPNFSETAKSTYRLIAMDLMGYGRSPKPNDSLYTLREHLDMIEKSVLEHFKLRTFHIVAHSLGCILALALAVRHPGSVMSLTLLAPPYYPVPKGVQPTQYVMRRVAPKQVWPPLAFGASVASWYEHITRTVSLVLCKNHHLLELLTRLFTRNRIRTYLIEGFFCHTHNASWHTLHNIIFGAGSKLDVYLDFVRDSLKCDVNIFHGSKDELIPVECSFNVQRRIPRARVDVVENKDHITIVVGRQKDFARELEEIWRRSSVQQEGS